MKPKKNALGVHLAVCEVGKDLTVDAARAIFERHMTFAPWMRGWDVAFLQDGKLTLPPEIYAEGAAVMAEGDINHINIWCGGLRVRILLPSASDIFN